ncbi:glutamate-5-semialdehyde dehydrogenase [Suttonella indologenes]|uniref:Gamma-glutamyl phosphate reductase n=1 Tax=Suttonella indologenes TaxID=13276 RepID=A0A380MK20_9GAMM|nr:glutamate-5-semialdehyde dehydrogenase [Suttonella indologenes]SUO91680.1 Gamma-glutamyl phosphate reductase [Suttonella indologenes]
MTLIDSLGKQAKAAAPLIAAASTTQKNRALQHLAQELEAQAQHILAVNAQDMQAAGEKGLDAALAERLELNPKRIESMIDGVRQIAALPDPIGEIAAMKTNAKRLQVGRMRVPLGVIGIIYESRPNVSIDAAALCLKSGNAVILRGGSEALNTNLVLQDCIERSLQAAGLPIAAVQMIKDSDRRHVQDLLQAADYVDVLIPRGGKGLVKLVSEQARMPVIKHLDGICHIYVDKAADMDKALRIVDNGKTYRYGICGATETLLVHQDIAAVFLPSIAEIFVSKGVEIRACEQTCQLLPQAKSAVEEDWRSEYLAPIISVKIVADIDSAIAHIEAYGSHHTDAIVTENLAAAQQFLRQVDSASVMLNTPTCFADGYEYGLGAEIGISTDKIHWRGPVGLEGLTSQKFIIISDGITR